jgi:Fe-S-cluster containining protein
MDNLSQAEQFLFSKWNGVKNLADREEFWSDVFDQYSKDATNVILPIAFNPQSVRMALELLDCPPGECGECCRYERIPIFEYDVERIVSNTPYTKKEIYELSTIIDKKVYLNGKDGCPFLKDNRCTIYKCRPDGCYLFPLQSPKDAEVNGKKVQQMTIRIKCRPALWVARKIILRALKEGNVLLPNLIVIPKKEVKDGPD